jgi:hypothetical protein
MSVAPVLKVRQARRETATARDHLIEAMDTAETAGQAIPCKTNPEAFTDDLLAFGGPRAHRVAVDLVRECLDCPVFDLCKTYVDEAKRSRNTQLYGVIGGRLVIATQHIEIDPRSYA